MTIRVVLAGAVAGILISTPGSSFGLSVNDPLTRLDATSSVAVLAQDWRAVAAQGTQAPVRHAQAQPGQPAQPAAQPPATPAAPPPAPIRTEILKFDNWTATCHEFAEGTRKRTCTAQLQVQQSGSNQIIFTWIIFINDSKQLVTLLQTPTGVTIAPGVELKLEKAAKRTIPFETCDNGNCTATQVIDNNLARDMSAATTVQVTVVAVNGNQVNFNFPLKGIDKALTHLRGKI